MTDTAASGTAVTDPAAPSIADSPRFMRRLIASKVALICLAYVTILILVAIVAPILLPDVATERTGDLAAVQQGPSGAHWLGTDSLGRDILDRILVGARITMSGVATALAVALALGVPVGLVAGFVGGWLDRAVTWVADMLFSLPTIVIILVVLAVFPQSMTAGMVTLGVLTAPGLLRVVRSTVIPVREELYVAAAQVAGLSNGYIIVRHVLPRVAGPIIVQSSLLAAAALLTQSGLAFLGLVVEAPAPSWGGMIAEGVQNIVSAPWLIWPPGLALALTTLAFGLLGDSVRDATTGAWSPPPSLRSRSRVPADVVASPETDKDTVLAVRDLDVAFRAHDGRATRVVEHASFDIRRGETLGLVGESGCGKSALAMSLVGVLPGTGFVESGQVWFDGENLATMTEAQLAKVRGRGIAVVSQEPMVSLNPAFRVGWQLAEVVRLHQSVSRREARRRAIDLLRQVDLPNPEEVASRYPHELSGGMAQRVVIARALAGEPDLLIADEPTTALDVTVQEGILALLKRLQRERSMAILLITHDWGVIADACDRTVVMYAGEVVEVADVFSIFERPLHPYTAGLLAANPHHTDDSTELYTIGGTVPPPGEWPSGCHFKARCSMATDACGAVEQIPLVGSADRLSRCLYTDDLEAISS
jgi:peptide/nickel transport system permease protein